MKRLTNDQYQKQKRQELERRLKTGELDDTMRPYLEWLRGNRVNEKSYEYHKKAQAIIRELHREHTLEEIGQWTNKYSTSAIQRLYSGHFEDITEEYAYVIFCYLRSVAP